VLHPEAVIVVSVRAGGRGEGVQRGLRATVSNGVHGDVEAAVERAMGVFWSRGYHATALPDLLRATKLSRGSLYAAFGDKHSLFLRALDRYIADGLTRMDIELDPRREPVDSLRAYLAGYVDRTSGANGRRGCLLVATAMELAGQDAEVGRRIASFFKAMEARVAEGLEKGQMGERFTLIDPARLPEKPARPNRPAILLIGLILGIGAGAGTAALQEANDRSARCAEDLATAFPFPVLAVVPEIFTLEDELQKKKRDLADAILNADNRMISTLTREDLEFLLS